MSPSDNEALYRHCAGLIERGFPRDAVENLSGGLALSRSQASALVRRMEKMTRDQGDIDTAELDGMVEELRENPRGRGRLATAVIGVLVLMGAVVAVMELSRSLWQRNQNTAGLVVLMGLGLLGLLGYLVLIRFRR